jgi:aromatic ring-cleaving dioxygenase
MDERAGWGSGGRSWPHFAFPGRRRKTARQWLMPSAVPPTPSVSTSASSAPAAGNADAGAAARYPVNRHAAYHAHVYFGPDTLAQARALVARAGERPGVQVGRVHEKPVGPHPQWSCQLSFGAADFDTLIPWLDAERGGLDVFVHGLTGDDLADHTTHAYWLGRAWPLKLSMFGA